MREIVPYSHIGQSSIASRSLKFQRDANGNVIQTRSLTSTDSNTQTTTTTFTIDDKVATVVGPANVAEGSQPVPTRYEYDNMRRVSKVTDALGHQATSTFDAISRPLTSSVNGDVQQTLTYTTNGKVQSVKDANNNTTQYTYDGFDRPIETTYPDSTLESVTYDNLDNVLSATTRAEITYSFAYDRLNRLTTKTPSTGAVVSYTYDLAGRTLTVSTPTVTGDPSTGTFSLAYDGAGRMYQEGYPDSKTVTATLDKNGNVTQLAYPGSGNNITHIFDQLDRLTSVSGFNASVAFAYDTASRRMSQVNGNGTGQGYSYDKVDNLIGMMIGGLKPNTTLGTPPRIDFGYSRNDAGQSQGKSVSDSKFVWQPSLASTITYGTANNLNQYPSVDSTSLTYDDNDCLVNDGTNTYGYDLENRLISVTMPSGTVTYKYDPFGRLALKTTSTSATRYVYSVMQRIEEYDNASGNVTYLHGDEVGSTILTTDSTGVPTRVNIYAPYGQLSSGSLSDIRVGYTGQFFEPDTGLYLYKARHYSPKIGRFLQPDPIGYKGGLNLYEYAGSDPINFCDPTGLWIGAALHAIGALAGKTLGFFGLGKAGAAVIPASVGVGQAAPAVAGGGLGLFGWGAIGLAGIFTSVGLPLMLIALTGGGGGSGGGTSSPLSGHVSYNTPPPTPSVDFFAMSVPFVAAPALEGAAAAAGTTAAGAATISAAPVIITVLLTATAIGILYAKSSTSGNNRYIEHGNAMHKIPPDGEHQWVRNQPIPGTRYRIDWYDKATGDIVEVKPDRPASVALGWKQAANYYRLMLLKNQRVRYFWVHTYPALK